MDRGRRDVERLRDLARGEAEHVAQQQHRPLPGRQVLKSGGERQLDALALLVAGGRRGEPVGEAGVGERLEPAQLGRGRRQLAMRVAGGAASSGTSRRGRRSSAFEADVRRDPVQPGAQRCCGALEPGQPAPGAHERLLERVLGVLDGAEHAVAMRLQLGAVRVRRAARSRARSRRPSRYRPACLAGSIASDGVAAQAWRAATRRSYGRSRITTPAWSDGHSRPIGVAGVRLSGLRPVTQPHCTGSDLPSAARPRTRSMRWSKAAAAAAGESLTSSLSPEVKPSAAGANLSHWSVKPPAPVSSRYGSWWALDSPGFLLLSSGSELRSQTTTVGVPVGAAGPASSSAACA